MPRAGGRHCQPGRPPEVTICLIEDQQPFDRELGDVIGALHLVRTAAAQRNNPGAEQAIEEDRRRLGAIARGRPISNTRYCEFVVRIAIDCVAANGKDPAIY